MVVGLSADRSDDVESGHFLEGFLEAFSLFSLFFLLFFYRPVLFRVRECDSWKRATVYYADIVGRIIQHTY